MKELLVIRHGQASFFEDNYDQLSELGHHQAYHLGLHLADHHQIPESIVCGPLKRQRQTLSAIREAFKKRGMELPLHTESVEFAEHHGPKVVRQVVSHRADQEEDVRQLIKKMKEKNIEAVKDYMPVYQGISLEWVAGEHEQFAKGIESWRTFCERVAKGFSNINLQSAWVITSGGPMAVLTGKALGATSEKIMELSWAVRNSAFSQFKFSENVIRLQSFNEVPHLSDKNWITLV